MKILVIGHHGFIGSAIFDSLEKAGHEVWRFNREDSLKWGSICHADVVINCAGETEDEDKMIDDNLIFPVKVAQACAAFKKRLIHIGSLSERAGNATLYSATKSAATHVIRCACPDSVALRPTTVYGNNDKPTAFLNKVWDSYVNNTVVSLTRQRRDWLHIDDLCSAVLVILNSTVSGIYEVGSGVMMENLDLIYLVEKYLKYTIKYDIELTKPAYFAPNSYELDRLGWRPKVKIDDGIRSFVDFKLFHNQAFLGAEAT